MDAANKPDRGPVQPRLASADLRLHQPPRAMPQSRIISGGGSRPCPGQRREWAAVPGRRLTPLRPGTSGRGGPGRSTPTSRRAPSRSPLRGASEMYVAKPLPTRRTKRKAGGAIGGANDEVEAQAPCGTRSGAAIVVPLVLAWAAGWFGTTGRRPPRRRDSAAVNSPGEWARRSPRCGPPPRATLGTAACGRAGGAVAAWAKRSRV
jgi:hypothetical protein